MTNQIGSISPGHAVGLDQLRPERSHRLHTLDSVRGIAALVVLIHHCLILQPAFSDYFFLGWQPKPSGIIQTILFYTPARLVWSGYEAVTLFFVLSGLVLALPWVEKRPPQYPDFLRRRICRIYLPYIIVLTIAVFLAAILQGRFHVTGGSEWVNTETWSKPMTLINVVQNVLMIGQADYHVNGSMHSLVWEMRVSVLFPILMLPLVRWGIRGAAIIALLLLILTAALQIVLNRYSGSETLSSGTIYFTAFETQKTAYFSIFFVIGATIAIYLGQIRTFLITYQRYYAGPIIMVVGLLLVQAHWSQTRAFHNLGVAAGAALIIVAALAPGRIETVLRHSWLLFLGRISYSVYLVQVPVLLLTTYLLQDVLPLWAMLIVVPALVLPLGWIFHERVAEPCARLGRRTTLPAAALRAT